MEDSMIAIAQSTIETANKNAAALAESVRASYDGDATDFEGFVDMLFSMFYIMSNEQFFEYLDILCDIYDVAFDPANTPFRGNGSLADIYVSTFVQAAFYKVKGVLIMKIVSNFNELITNSQTLDGYLRSQVDPEYDFALNLIKKGTCFVAVGVSGAYKFYPSRFIGYADNSMDAHLNNVEKDGKETNPAISKILGAKPSINSILNQEYARYCEALGFVPRDKGAFGTERKFWVIEK